MPTCGEDHSWRVCDNCGDDHKIGSTCDRWACPRCYKRAVLHAATSVTAKLAHYRDKYAKGDSLRFHRVVIVPPPDEDFSTVADPLDKLYEVAGDLLDFGSSHHGGVRIPHPYRHADEPDPATASDRALSLVGGDNDDQGVWKHTLPDWSDDYTPSWEETRGRLSHEPHIHAYVISEGFWLPTKKIEEETGWVIRRLEPYENNDVSCYNVEDLARSVMYALSHCGDYDNAQKHFRYFGALSNEPASDAQKARMRSICRDYAGHVLGLDTSSVSCKRDVSDAESPVLSGDGNDGADGFGGGGSSGGGGDGAVAVGDSDYTPCGGSLRRIKYVPDLIEENAEKWSSETKQRLRELHAEVIGPPD
jgi:uncharacterized membrane protein YgcG